MGKWTQKEEERKHLRVFLFGETGTYKTRLALECPNVGLLPFESGYVHYEKEYKEKGKPFLKLLPDGNQWTFNEILDNLKELFKGNVPDHPSGGKMQTLVIDTIGGIIAGVEGIIVYEQLDAIARSSRPNKSDLNQGDWGKMKRKYSQLNFILDKLQMNVIALGRLTKDHDSKEWIEFAERSTKYYYDMVIELRWLTKKKRVAYVWKDRTGHYDRHQEIINPTWENLFKEVFDDLQAGKVQFQTESGGEPVEEPEEATKEEPKKKSKPQPPKKVGTKTPQKDDPKPKSPTKKAKDSTKGGKKDKDFETGHMLIDGKKYPYANKPKDVTDKRAFLMGIRNNEKHPLREQLTAMLTDAEVDPNTALAPLEAGGTLEDEDVETIWEMLIDNNPDITIKEGQ